MEMTRRVAKDQANGLLILPIGSDKDYNLSEIQPIPISNTGTSYRIFSNIPIVKIA